MIKMKELLMEENQQVTNFYLDMDGVICDFSKQYYNYLTNDMLWMSVLNDRKVISQGKLDKLGINKQQFIAKAEVIRQKALKRDDVYEYLKSTFKKELLCNPAWKLIVFGGENFWATMDWQKGGKELVAFLKSTNIPIEILTAGAGDTAGRGKQAWLSKNGLGDLPFNKTNSGKEKYKLAKPGWLLIDDMDENIELFVKSGGLGVIHTDVNKTISELKQMI